MRTLLPWIVGETTLVERPVYSVTRRPVASKRRTKS
jgi:hypothetical protein